MYCYICQKYSLDIFSIREKTHLWKIIQHLLDCWRLWLRLQGDRPGWLENNVWVFPRAAPGELCHLTQSTPKGRLCHPKEGPAGVRIGSFVVSKRKHDLDRLVIYSNSHWFKNWKSPTSVWSELASGVAGLEDLQQAEWGYSSQACCESSLVLLLQADSGELRRRWITAPQWQQQDGDTDICG